MQLTDTQLRTILAGLEKIIAGPGFGTLELVVEKRRLIRIRTTVDEWIDRAPARGDPVPSPRADHP